jgi:glucokinase
MPALQVIGVDVGGTSIRAARFVGHSHIPVAKTKVPTQAAKGADAVLQRLEAAIRQVAGHELDNVAGIGIAAAGPLNPHTGIVLNAPNLPGWQNLPLKQLMEDRLHRPVFIGNDANLAALGEWKFGAARGHQDVLYLTISTGIGGGVITSGRLLVGANGLGAEVGHMMAVPEGALCGCGQRGHLEAMASGTAIAAAARSRLQAGNEPTSKLWQLSGGDVGHVTGAMVGEAALAGDDFAVGLIAEAGGFIGRTLASLLHAFNSSIVVCGGGVSLLGDVILNPIRASVREHVMSEAYWRDCPIVLAELGDDAGLVGAGALVMESMPAEVAGAVPAAFQTAA